MSLPSFFNMTSVHANLNDTLAVVSGYSHSVALNDLATGNAQRSLGSRALLSPTTFWQVKIC